MSKKLYVGNLPFSVTSEELKSMFAEYGEISEAMVIVNKFSGRSKGFGFVTIADDSQASKAVTEMNGKDFQGRKLFVNEAKPFDPNAPRPERRGGFGGGRGGFGGGRGFGGRREGGFGGRGRRDNRDSEDF